MELKRTRVLKRRNLPRYSGGTPDTTTNAGATNTNTSTGSTTNAGKMAGSTGDVGGVAQGAIGFAGATINAFSGTPTTNELVAQAGNQVGYGVGFQYNKIGSINAGQLMDELSANNTSNTLKTAGAGAALGASVGSFFPGIGTAIGAVAGGIIGGAVGLFGGASRKAKLRRRIAEALNNILRTNDYRLASALSDYMQNQFNLDHGDIQGGLIYAANRGKDLVRPKRIKR